MVINGLKEKTTNIPLYLAIIVPFFCGFGKMASAIVCLLELLILLFYLPQKKFWWLAPIFYIYYTQLKIGSLTFFNVYIMLAALKMFFIDKNFVFYKSSTWCILILIIYAAIVLALQDTLWTGALLLIQSLISFFSLQKISRDEDTVSKLKFVLVAMCLSAALYGLFFRNIKGSYETVEGLVQYTGRYSGTMSDPNYMAFFYSLSYCTVLFARFKFFAIKWVLAGLLFLCIALTGSITAILNYAVVLIAYIFFAREEKSSQKRIGVIIITIFSVCFLLYLFSDLDNIPILNMYKERLLEKINDLISGDIDGVTTGRTEYSGLYVEYLFQQDVFRILFGGYQLNAMGLIGEAADKISYAAHNSYVDVLMTCGVVGLVVFVAAFITRLIKIFNDWQKGRNVNDISRLIYIIIALIYMGGLSVFPGVNYMFFLLL